MAFDDNIVAARIRVAIIALAVALMACAAQAEDRNADTGVDADGVEETLDFMVGNAISILFHETGHMLISALELPVLGREEDAVDNLAALLLLEWDEEEADQALIDSADAWFFSDLEQDEQNAEPVYYGEHGLNQQRAYQTVCLMVGGKPGLFADYADEVELPKERQESCRRDFEQARTSWFDLLSDHVLEDDDTPSAVTYRYDAAPDDLSYVRDALRDANVLKDTAEFVATTFRLPYSVTFVAGSCGQPNAFWTPGTREITLCYELMDYYADLIIRDIAER